MCHGLRIEHYSSKRYSLILFETFFIFLCKYNDSLVEGLFTRMNYVLTVMVLLYEPSANSTGLYTFPLKYAIWNFFFNTFIWPSVISCLIYLIGLTLSTFRNAEILQGSQTFKYHCRWCETRLLQNWSPILMACMQWNCYHNVSLSKL